MNLYNEHDPYAADWIEGLMAAGLVPPLAAVFLRAVIEAVDVDEPKEA